MIQQGQSGTVEVTNGGQATLSLVEANMSSDDLTCVGCAGVALIRVRARNSMCSGRYPKALKAALKNS